MIGVKRNNRRWKSRFAMTAAPAALALALVRTTPALGTTYWWIDSSANWSFTNDWSLSQNGAQVFSVPSANSNVNIIDTDASPRTVAYDYTPGVTLNNLTVDQTGGGINTLNIPANNLSAANEFIGVNGAGTVVQEGGNNTISGGLYLGEENGSNGTYILTGGTLSAGNVYLGETPGAPAQGTLTVSGSGTLNVPGTLSVYDTLGSGGLNLQVGGLINTGYLNLGRQSGLFNWTGGELNVGKGDVEIDNSSNATLGSSLSIINGKTLSVQNNLIVGGSGAGSVTQTGGNNFISGNLNLGSGVSSSGAYTLSFGYLYATNETIGGSGTGLITQSGGNNIISGGLYLGQSNNSAGTYNLSGGTLSAPNVHLGVASGVPIAGVLTVSGGGSLTIPSTGTLTVYGASGSSLNLQTGGTIITGALNLTGQAGSFNWTGGSLNLTNTTVDIDSSGNANLGSSLSLAAGQSLSVSGSSGNGGEVIGSSGTGSVTQTGGSNTMSGDLVLGTLFNSISGTYSLSGGTLNAAGAFLGGGENGLTTTGILTVSGTGALTIPSTGLLQVFASGNSALNLQGGSITTGILDLQGNNSDFNWTGGTLHLTNSGATIDSSASALKSSLTLNSGMGLEVAGYEYVGFTGTGTINQTGGTNAIDFFYPLFIGYGNGSTGAYSLSGSGSLISTGNEYVGASGSGSFTQSGGTNTITSGGELSIAQNAGSTGNYALSSGAASAANVYVGGSDVGPGGAGVMTVSGSGSLTALQGITVFNTSGSGLNVNGGTVSATALNLPGNYSQSGGFAKFGQITGAGHMTISGGQLNLNGDLQSQSGILTVSGSSTLGFDIGTNAASELVASTATFSGAPTIAFTLSGFPSAGTVYTLLSSTHFTDNGHLAGLSSNPVTINREILTPSFTGGGGNTGSIIVTVSGGPASLSWIGNNAINAGDSGGSWDTQTTHNWNNSTTPALTPDILYPGDNVTFDDSASNFVVDLNEGNVMPSSVTFNNSSHAYTVNGVSGISGAAAVNFIGSNSVTLTNNNTYTGTTTISGGGTVSITGTNASSTFNVNNGTLQLATNNQLTTNPVINLGANTTNGTLDLNGSNNTVGGLASANGNAVVTNSSVNQANLNYAGGSGTYIGVIQENGHGPISLTVSTGSLTLSSGNDYAAGTTINGGTLTAANSVGSATGSGDIIINGGVLASGTAGNISGNVLAGSSAHTIAPGGIGSIGTLAVGGLITSNLTTINFDLGTGFGEVTNGDLLVLGQGSVSIASGTALTFGGVPDPGDHYRLIADSVGGYIVDQVDLSNFTLPSATGFSYTLSDSVDPGYIDLIFASTGPASLTWNNTGAPAPTDGVTWDAVNNNWFSGAFPSMYADGDGITFNDTNNGHYAVNLSSVVNPLLVTFNNSAGNYVVSGTGSIAGATSLIKSGTGAVTLNTANTYTGGTTIQAGTIIVGNEAALGTGTLTASATLGSTATIEAGGGGPYTINNTIDLQTTLHVGGANNLALSGAIFDSGGLTMDGTGVLALNGTNTFTGAVTVNSGTVVQNTSLTCNVLNNATYTYNGGGFTGRLTNTGIANFNANFTAGNGMENDGVAIVGTGVNMTFNGAGLNNAGSLSMTGGVLALSQTSASSNSGTMTLAGTALVQLGNAGVLNNTASMYLIGTVINGPTGQLNNNAGGAINGTATIQSAFTNNGLVDIGTAGTMNITQAFNNGGTIQLTNSGLTGGAVTNTGTIDGSGNVSSPTVNASNGTIEASGGNLSFGGSLTNQIGGLLTADAGAKLIITQGLATNAGIINLTGGTFDNNGHALNNAGQISGYGTFRFGGTGLTNNASVTFSGGTSTINGNVTNQSGQKITVANNPAIFTGNVVNNGTFKATNTTVTFAGTYTGGFTSDPSTEVFQSNVTVPAGSSMTGGPGDQYYMSDGTFTNHGTFNNGGLLQSSDPTTNSGSFTESGTQVWSLDTSFSNTAGTATFASDAGSALSSPLSINDTAGSVAFGSTQHLASLAISSGATTTASTSSPRNVIVAGSLSVIGSLNLTNNDLIVHNGNLSTIDGEIIEGRGAGNAWWTGTMGITSSAAAATADTTALGVELNNNGAGGTLTTSFDGQTVTATDVLVKYTFVGDADLSGTVNAADYMLIDNGFNSGGSKTGWRNGDFNYDGVINGDDYTLIDNAFNTEGSVSFAATLAGPAEMIAGNTEIVAGGVASPQVPEPASLGLLGIGAISLLGQRRRRR